MNTSEQPRHHRPAIPLDGVSRVRIPPPPLRNRLFAGKTSGQPRGLGAASAVTYTNVVQLRFRNSSSHLLLAWGIFGYLSVRSWQSALRAQGGERTLASLLCDLLRWRRRKQQTACLSSTATCCVIFPVFECYERRPNRHRVRYIRDPECGFPRIYLLGTSVNRPFSDAPDLAGWHHVRAY